MILEAECGGESNHSPVTCALRTSTYRAGVGAAKAALLNLVRGLSIGITTRQRGEKDMHERLITMYVKFQNLMSGEQGQDLVEYGLLCTLIALAMISSLTPIATAVSRVFGNVSSSLA